MRLILCKGKTKGKDGKDKVESKSSSPNKNKNKKCYVKADCRKKKRDDEERKTTLAQNSLTSSSDVTSISGASTSTTHCFRLTSRMMNFHEDLCFSKPVCTSIG